MSENTNRPVAVWRERGDALHTMECSNCGADAHYQIVDGVWRYEPYCAHCGARVYKQEDLPKHESKKSRWAEQEIETAKAIKLLAPAMDYIERIAENRSELYSKLDFGAAYLQIPCIPSMKVGERIALNDIIGGRE